MAAQPASLREIRAELRKLPRERRREIVNAIRAGRAVNDPRDAPLAAAWADYLDQRRHTWPRWIMPRERPHGRHAWLWLVHVALLLASIGLACRILLNYRDLHLLYRQEGVDGRILFDSYHCSRYNTQTRRLSAPMFDGIFARARHLLAD